MSNYMTYLFAWHIKNMEMKLVTSLNYRRNCFISGKSGEKSLPQSDVNFPLEKMVSLQKPEWKISPI